MPVPTSILLKDRGKKLFEQFALPSERNMVRSLFSMHNELGTPFAYQALTKDIGRPIATAEDAAINALESLASGHSASFQRHSPEMQGLATKIWARIQKAHGPQPGRTANALQMLREMADTPERQRLLDKLAPYVEEHLSKPGIQEAWLGGSWVTKKRAPADIDLLTKNQRSFRRRFWSEADQSNALMTTIRNASPSGRADIEDLLAQKDPLMDQAARLNPDIVPNLHIIPWWSDKGQGYVKSFPKEKAIMEKGGVTRRGYNPNDYKFVRLFGAVATALGASHLLTPDEAEAASPRQVKELAKRVGQEGVDKLPKSWIRRLRAVEFFDELDSLNLPGDGRYFKPSKKVQLSAFASMKNYLNPSLMSHEIAHSGWEQLLPAEREIFQKEIMKNPRQWARSYPNYYKWLLEDLKSRPQDTEKELAHFAKKYGEELWTTAVAERATGRAPFAFGIAGRTEGRLLGQEEDLIEKMPKVQVYSRLSKEAKSVVDKYVKALKVGLGAAAVGSMLSPDEAEAGPIPKKLTQTALEKMGVESSASYRLKGMPLLDKIIKSVRKGRGNWRYIIFEDDSYLTLDKKYIASLSSGEGEKLYSTMYEMLPPSGQKAALKRSHALKQAAQVPPSELKKGLLAREEHLKELGEEPPPRVGMMFKGKQTQIPAAYAEGLKEVGEANIGTMIRTPKAKAPTKLVYDFGGGEYPEEGASHVIDIMSPKEFTKGLKDMDMSFSGKYVQHDLTKPLTMPKRGEVINVSKMLRYVGHPTGFLEGQKVPVDKLESVARNIDGNLAPKGEVRIFDHLEMIGPVANFLKRKGYTVIKRPELVNPADSGLPAEYLVILQKPGG